ncbi:uncharacterized protein RSE6_04969 [Rhynchosporium secalis]|uniref:Uncharacterized protein n=1 Tax=Rhynchosporium secalis TaxID=38038 RepID=A0A1E1M6M0_RHYSE|nr:uncharacterized protein RSE6_04969 [Rhynchosporium secalis]
MVEVINNATFRESKEALGEDKPITGSDAPKEFSIFYPMRKKEWESVSDPREPHIPPEGDCEEELKENISQVPDSWEADFVAGRTGKIQEWEEVATLMLAWIETGLVGVIEHWQEPIKMLCIVCWKSLFLQQNSWIWHQSQSVSGDLRDAKDSLTESLCQIVSESKVVPKQSSKLREVVERVTARERKDSLGVKKPVTDPPRMMKFSSTFCVPVPVQTNPTVKLTPASGFSMNPVVNIGRQSTQRTPMLDVLGDVTAVVVPAKPSCVEEIATLLFAELLSVGS